MTGTPMAVRCNICGAAWNLDLDLDPTACTCEEGGEWRFDTEALIVSLITSGALMGVEVFGGDNEGGFGYGLCDRFSEAHPGGSDCNRADDYLMRPSDEYLTPAVKAALHDEGASWAAFDAEQRKRFPQKKPVVTMAERQIAQLIEDGVLVGVSVEGYDYEITERGGTFASYASHEWLVRLAEKCWTPFVEAALWPKDAS